MVSQKCQYAIRAIFELAKRQGQGPVKIKDIAEVQAIPMRFLEIILNQLRRSGFVQSKRGAEGGYILARSPDKLMVGEIMQFAEGPLAPVACMTDKAGGECVLYGSCVFLGLWERASKALSEVYDQTSFQDLVNSEAKMRETSHLSFSI
jgi:Rrf2 family cysteine metabolism transcriptional repressor